MKTMKKKRNGILLNLWHPRRVMNLTPAAQLVGGSLGAFR